MNALAIYSSIAGVPSSQALPGFFMTAPGSPSVCVPAVIGALVVMRVVRDGSGAKAPPLAARLKLAGWVAVFLIVYRQNAGRLGSSFISVRLETRWLGQKNGFYVLELPCRGVPCQSAYG